MDTLDALKTRRAINFFDPARNVPLETIGEIIRAANLAPSSFNLQPWEVIIVTDPARKEALKKCSGGQPKITEAPATLIVIANPGALEENIDRVLDNQVELGYTRKEDRDKIRGGPFRQYGDPDSETRRLFAVKNTAFFAMAFMLAARSMDLHTHPMDGMDPEMIKNEFHIPGNRIIPLLIAIGYPRPGLTLLPPKFRRDDAEFVKVDDYRRQI